MKINFYNKIEKKFLNWIKDYSKKNNMDINISVWGVPVNINKNIRSATRRLKFVSSEK